jgi:hypothetical protein
MSGEHFVIALFVVFAAFGVWLVVQIINRERWAIPIAVGLAAAVSVIAAVLGSAIWMSRGV